MQLADLNQGVIGLSFRYVDCSTSSNPGSGSVPTGTQQQVGYQQQQGLAPSNNGGSWADRFRRRFFGGRR
jgi:hypothetical protein